MVSDVSGAYPQFANVSTLGEIQCECKQNQNNETSIAATAHEVSYELHLKPLGNVTDEKDGKGAKKEFNFYFLEYLIPILLAALWVNFVVLFYWTMKIVEIDEQTVRGGYPQKGLMTSLRSLKRSLQNAAQGATAIAPENRVGNKEVYVLIFHTSYVQVCAGEHSSCCSGSFSFF